MKNSLKFFSSLLAILILSCQEKQDIQVIGPQKKTYHLSGKITDFDTNLPLPDVRLSLFKKTSGDSLATTFTDSSGMYQFTNLEEGAYKILVTKPKYVDFSFDVQITSTSLNYHVKLFKKLILVETFPSPVDYPIGIAYDGASFWLADSSQNSIYQLGKDFSITKIFQSPVSQPQGLAWDGSHFWISAQLQIFQTDANFNLLNAYDLFYMTNYGPFPATDLTFDGSQIWSCNTYADSIKQHASDLSTSFAKHIFHAGGIAWDGKNLWVSGLGKIYKLNNEKTIELTFGAPTESYPITWGDSLLVMLDKRHNRIFQYKNSLW